MSRSWPTSSSSKGEWTRAFSASDILGMQRAPTRRPFDHPHPNQDGFGGNRSITETSSLHLLDDTEDVRCPESPASRSIREHATDHWKVGDSMRILHHIEPKKYRQISLYGEVFQGFYNHDWHHVDHIKHVRAKCPTNRRLLEPVSGPYPQGEIQEEHNRNRNYAASHGSPKVTGGVMRNGPLLMVP